MAIACSNSVVCGFDDSAIYSFDGTALCGFAGFVGAVVCSFDNNIVCDFEAGPKAGYPLRGECLVRERKMSKGYLLAA
jgi:hypothetical protein